MKKHILTQMFVVAALTASAQNYNWGSGSDTLQLDSSLNNVATITIGKPNDTSATGAYNTVDGSSITFGVAVSGTSHLTTYASIDFKNKVTFTNGPNWWTRSEVRGFASEGQTTKITFQDFKFNSNGQGNNAGVNFYNGDTNKGTVIVSLLGSSNLTGGTLLYGNVIVELGATSGIAFGDGKTDTTFGLRDGNTLRLLAANQFSQTSRIASRITTTAEGTHLGGIVEMGGFDLTFRNLEFRHESTNKNLLGIEQIFDFGGNAGVSQSLTITADFAFANLALGDDQKALCRLTIKGYESGVDHLYLAKDYTTDSALKNLVQFDFGGLDYDLVVKEISTGKFEYIATVIPEPSTYAIIFGAIALGFVAYRRRK